MKTGEDHTRYTFQRSELVGPVCRVMPTARGRAVVKAR
jgi:hypothetical protein